MSASLTESDKLPFSQRLPPELLTDGIRASYYHWIRVKGVVPFFFNFIDYLVLALPEAVDVVIAENETAEGRKVSTNPDHLPGDRPPAQASLRLHDGGPLLWLESAGDSGSAMAYIREVLGRFDARLRCRVARVLRMGLKKVSPVQSTRNRVDATSCRTHSNLHSRARQDVVDQIIRQTQHNLACAITAGDESHTFAIRRLTCEDALEGFAYRRNQDGATAPKSVPIASEWVPEIHRVFHTGFVRLKALDPRHMLLCVPCHFGGVPWLVLCRVITNDPSGHWVAYTIYRDVIPRLNDSLRFRGQDSFASEMRRLFKGAVRDVRRDVDSLIGDVAEVWKYLPCVYPVRRPVLIERSPAQGAPKREDELLLHLDNSYIEVDFADDADPCTPAATGLHSEKGEAWGTIGRQVIRAGFVMPVQAELHEQQAIRAGDLAESVYAIGHPLKHRLGRVKQAIETELEALSVQPLILEDARCHCHRARLFAKKAEHTASMMDLMADLSQHGDISRIDGKFLSREPYRIGLGFRSALADSHQAGHTIEIDNADLNKLDDLVVVAESPRPRLFDPFYDDIIFELLFNANRYRLPDARRIAVSIEEIAGDFPSCGEPRPCIVLSNPTREISLGRLWLEADRWTRWRTDKGGPKGGLRLLANELRLTRAGDLLARPSRDGNHHVFSVAVFFQGIKCERGDKE